MFSGHFPGHGRGDAIVRGYDIALGFAPEGDKTQEGDWTLGCIAVTDAEIEEIWSLVRDGTPIEIAP